MAFTDWATNQALWDPHNHHRFPPLVCTVGRWGTYNLTQSHWTRPLCAGDIWCPARRGSRLCIHNLSWRLVSLAGALVNPTSVSFRHPQLPWRWWSHPLVGYFLYRLAAQSWRLRQVRRRCCLAVFSWRWCLAWGLRLRPFGSNSHIQTRLLAVIEIGLVVRITLLTERGKLTVSLQKQQTIESGLHISLGSPAQKKTLFFRKYFPRKQWQELILVLIFLSESLQNLHFILLNSRLTMFLLLGPLAWGIPPQQKANISKSLLGLPQGMCLGLQSGSGWFLASNGWCHSARIHPSIGLVP